MKRLALLVLVAFSLHAYDAKSTCVKCHSNKELLKKLGAPQMYMDPAKVDEEVNMAGEPTCVDCHLGNNKTMDMTKAHKGMLKPFYAAIGKHHKYQYIDRSVTNYDRILPKGKKRFAVLMRKPTKEVKEKYGIKKLMQLFYHDRDTATFAFNIKIAEKTCGKCHEEEVKNYKHTSMALSMYQRAFQDWTKSPPGPQNCGVWFANNYNTLKGECTRDYTKKMANSATRGCNKCHTSCLDCHYAGYKKSVTSHKFLQEPDAMSLISPTIFRKQLELCCISYKKVLHIRIANTRFIQQLYKLERNLLQQNLQYQNYLSEMKEILSYTANRIFIHQSQIHG